MKRLRFKAADSHVCFSTMRPRANTLTSIVNDDFMRVNQTLLPFDVEERKYQESFVSVRFEGVRFEHVTT